MKKFFSSIKTLFKQHPDILFFFFTTLVFVLMYIWSLSINPALIRPGTLILFTFLTILHICIHWVLLFIGEEERWFWPYVIVQALLAFAIILLSQNVGMIFALYLAMIGEIVGMGMRRVWKVTAVVLLLGLSVVSQVILGGGVGSPFLWLLTMSMGMIFVVLFVSLYTLESKAKQAAQELLEELDAANRQLSAYADQVEDLTLTNERQRMARELHDTLAQGLAGLILQLEAADSYMVSGHGERAQSIIQQAMLRARTTLNEARQAITDLRETPSTTADLSKAIRDEVDHFAHITGINCRVNIDIPDKLPPEVAENALRSVSEGLINVARHARASHVNIQMNSTNHGLRIEIRDDGIGFDPRTLIGKPGHYGLVGMRERARISGGSLTIESRPNQGTTLKIQLPTEKSKADE
jgi:NarL family two-component system sensor histidine kinase YdfH